MLDAVKLQQCLAQVQPRQARLLVDRCVDGLSRDQLAERWGTTADAVDVLLLRAALALHAVAEGQPRPAPQAFEHEQRLAASLRAELETGAATGPAVTLAALTEQKDAVRAELMKAEAAAESGPARAREARLRAALVVVVLAVAAWFSREQLLEWLLGALRSR